MTRLWLCIQFAWAAAPFAIGLYQWLFTKPMTKEEEDVLIYHT